MLATSHKNSNLIRSNLFRVKSTQVVVGFLLGIITNIILLQLNELRSGLKIVPFHIQDILKGVPLLLLLGISGFLVVKINFHHIRNGAQWFLLFFFLRILVSLFLWGSMQYDDEFGLWFDRQNGLHDNLVMFRSRGYDKLIYFISSWATGGYFIPRLCNSALGALLAFFCYDIAHCVFQDEKKSIRALVFIGLLPPVVIFSGVHLKEIGTATGVCVALWCLCIGRTLWLQLLGGTLCALFLVWFRGASWALPVVLMVVGKILNHFRKVMLFQKAQQWTLMWLVAFAVIMTFFINSAYDSFLFRLYMDTSYFSQFRFRTATYSQFMNQEDLLSVQNILISVVRSVFSPHPLRFLFDLGPVSIVEFTVSLTWYLLFPFFLLGFWYSKARESGLLSSFAFVSIFFMASMEMIGADWGRHRIILMPLFLIFAAGGHREFSTKLWLKKPICLSWALAVTVFSYCWFSLRIGK